MTATDNAQLIEDLKATKAVLRNNGRCSSGPWGGGNSACLAISTVRAIGAAAHSERVQRSRAVRDALLMFLLQEFPNLVVFNEATDTTDADVFALIDKALAEAGGLA